MENKDKETSWDEIIGYFLLLFFGVLMILWGISLASDISKKTTEINNKINKIIEYIEKEQKNDRK